jgi:hypothetical protein
VWRRAAKEEARRLKELERLRIAEERELKKMEAARCGGGREEGCERQDEASAVDTAQ